MAPVCMVKMWRLEFFMMQGSDPDGSLLRDLAR